MRSALLALLIAGCMLSGCGRKARRVSVPAAPLKVKKGYTEQGVASWYGHPYHGRRTANGEIYNMNELTAAHQTLPFGVWVTVENLKNRRDVEVRINDRGPFVGGRIIDLSRAAARSIEMIGPGTAKVKIKVIRIP